MRFLLGKRFQSSRRHCIEEKFTIISIHFLEYQVWVVNHSLECPIHFEKVLQRLLVLCYLLLGALECILELL